MELDRFPLEFEPCTPPSSSWVSYRSDRTLHKQFPARTVPILRQGMLHPFIGNLRVHSHGASPGSSVGSVLAIPGTS